MNVFPDAPARRLPVMVRPLPEETLLGLVVRLAEANWLPSVSWLLTDAAQTPAKLQTAAAPLGRLAVLSGLPRDDLEELAYPSAGPGLRRIGEADVPDRSLSFERRRVCPDCLRLSGHHRRLWDLSFVTACPDHGTRLRTACDCGRFLGWDWPSVASCRCGADLRRLTAPPAAAEEIDFCAFVQAVIQGAPSARRTLGAFVDEGLPQLLGIFDFVGRFDVDLGIATAKRPVDPLEVRRVGFRHLIDWPSRFRALLVDLESARLARYVWPYWNVMDLRRALLQQPRVGVYAAIWEEIENSLDSPQRYRRSDAKSGLRDP